MSTWRLFVAVPLPEAALELLAVVQRDLATSGADVKWSDPGQIHLTLKFLGDTPEEAVAELSAALDEAASGCPPCVGRLAEVGAFPNAHRPRVVWVGLNEATGELVRLQKRVDEATSYLVPPDPRGFTAHLTLGRVRSGKNLARLTALLEGYKLESKIDIPLAEVLLIRSVLERSGPSYTDLHRAALGAR